MELRHLRYFVATAKALSFSRAALQLHVTQPALSRQIRDLEDELGGALLRRGKNEKTELTVAGRRFLTGAERLLKIAERLKESVREPRNKLKIGHYGSVWLDYFTPALRRFARKNQNVNLQLIEKTPAELRLALRSGEVDLAFVGGSDQALRREFTAQKVAQVNARLLLPATHPLAKKRKIRLLELAKAEWISWDEKAFPGRTPLFIEVCRRAGFRPKIAGLTDSIASMVVRVATSEAIGFALPMASQLPHQGVVFADLVEPDVIVFDMHVAYSSKHPKSAEIEKLVQELLS